jgi:hypothetical protein
MIIKLQFLTCKKYSEEWSTVKNCNFSKVQFFNCTSTVIPLHIFAVYHIRRFQEYFNHIHIFIGSTTPQFLKFWYQNGVNILFLVVKPIKVTSGFILKLMKKIARWRRCWNIWHLSLKTKISPLVVRYQESNGCQKNWQDLRNSDLEVYCATI